MGLVHWSDAQQQGVSFYVTNEGQLRLRHHGLTAAALQELKAHRAPIVAEWLWTLDPLPDALAWDEDVAAFVIEQAVGWLAGPALPEGFDGAGLQEVQNRVDQAWHERRLLALVAACRRWVLTVFERRAADTSMSRGSSYVGANAR